MSSLTSGGIITDENRLDDKYLIAVLNSYRAYMIPESWKKERKVYPGIYQTLWIDYDPNAQDEQCVRIFPCPSVLQIAPHLFGINYVGSVKRDQSFRLTLTRGAQANKQKHRIMKRSSRKIDILYDPGQGILETDDLDLKHIRIDAAWRNPLDIPTYNIETDQYPLPDDVIEIILDLLNKGTLRTIIQVPANKVGNSQDDATILRR